MAERCVDNGSMRESLDEQVDAADAVKMSTDEKPFILVSIDSATAAEEAVDAKSGPDERVDAVDAEISEADVSTGGNTLGVAIEASLAAGVTQYDEIFMVWRKEGIFTIKSK